MFQGLLLTRETIQKGRILNDSTVFLNLNGKELIFFLYFSKIPITDTLTAFHTKFLNWNKQKSFWLAILWGFKTDWSIKFY